MGRNERIRKRRLLVEPGTPAGLNERDPAWTGGAEFELLSKDKLTSPAKEILVETIRSLGVSWPEVSEADRVANAKARELLEAEDEHAAR